jgi:hypothetical protein
VKHKKPKISSRTIAPQDALKQKNQKEEVLEMGFYPVVFTFLIFLAKTVFGAVLLAIILFLVSYLFFFPEPEIKITKTFDSPKMTSYDILVRNPSRMDIHQLTIAFRFDENYPVSSYYLDEPQYTTGFVLKPGFISRLTVSVGDKVSEKPFYNPFKYTSGVQAITNMLGPDSSATFYVNIDKTYNGPKEQVFPISLMHSLRSNSYFMTFKYWPLGVFAPISITKKGCYDFDGHKTEADNYGKEYKQKILGPDGKTNTFILPVNK